MRRNLSEGRVSIGPLRLDDEAAFLAAVTESVTLHDQWVTPPRTPAQFADLLARLSQPNTHGFVARQIGTGTLVGMLTITNVVLGRFRSAHVGYYAFAGAAGRGLMREALELVVRRAFGDLGLHRLEAAIQPTNRRSIALVRSVGFRYEGLSPRYLWIEDDWRDHERWAITSEDLA